MSASRLICNFIKRWETRRLSVYDDGYSNLTIGYGHLWTPDIAKVITPELADSLFNVDIHKAQVVVQEGIKVSLSQCALDALVSFTFNVGGTAAERSNVFKAINEGNKDEAVMCLVGWCHEKSKISEGLLRRRIAEASIFLGMETEGYA
jgi:lysozyme